MIFKNHIEAKQFEISLEQETRLMQQAFQNLMSH